jgi:hypothetical protein
MSAPTKMWFAAAVVVVVAVAGCGSTLQTGGEGSVGSGLSPNSTASTLPGANGVGTSAAAGAAGPAGTIGGGSAAASPGTTGAGFGATNNTAGTGSLGANQLGPGITAKQVFIGLPYNSQAAQGDKEIGGAGAAPSYDTRDVYNAAINYANAHGGFAGRKLVPIFYNYNLTDDTSVQDQSACSAWTQDHKVFLIAAADDILRACAEKAHVVGIGVGGSTKSTFNRFPHYVEPDAIRLDRLGPITVNGLVKAGYFTGKLGFVTWDDPNYRYAYSNGYVPALAANHITLTDKAFISVPQAVGAIADSSAAVSSAVTKFRSEGIDHVIIQDGPDGVFSGEGLTFEWLHQAENQHWFPRYGQNALNFPGSTIEPKDQMDKAIAILDSDYEPKNDAGWHANPARQKCFQIQAAAGFPVSSGNANDEGIAAQVCDLVFFTQLVFNRMGTTLTNETFINALTGIGRQFPSAFVYGTQVSPTQRDASAAVRSAEYLASCDCVQYRGAPYYPG